MTDLQTRARAELIKLMRGCMAATGDDWDTAFILANNTVNQEIMNLDILMRGDICEFKQYLDEHTDRLLLQYAMVRESAWLKDFYYNNEKND